MTYIPPPESLDGLPQLRPVKRKTRTRTGMLRKRWEDDRGDLYEWDYRLGRLEHYDKRGRHLGEIDPATGAQTKPADPTRSIKP